MKRYDIIQYLIDGYNLQSYLEIGYLDGECFNKIKCPYKVSVDPNGRAMFRGTSDEFFEHNLEKFDLIFIDGLHLKDQVLKDIINSLKYLSKNGFIVLHDMLPATKEQQLPENMNAGIPWTGDAWKAFAILRMTRDDLEMYTVDNDYGCGIIQRGHQELFVPSAPEDPILTWEFFQQNRAKLMNCVDKIT